MSRQNKDLHSQIVGSLIDIQVLGRIDLHAPAQPQYRILVSRNLHRLCFRELPEPFHRADHNADHFGSQTSDL